MRSVAMMWKTKGTKKMTNIAVLGYGIVGSGIVEILTKNRADIDMRSGDSINVKYILDIRAFPGDANAHKITDDFEKIINDPEINIICEAIGGLSPAYDFSKRALLMGKSVITSNKELVAAHGAELLRLARENKCSYLFEAAVGGGIPIIRPLVSSLTAENIERIMGILNGTTNYILSKMEKDGATYTESLAQAQQLGYAESDPKADVEGDDTCRKLAILASQMTGRRVKYENIPTEGITRISAADFDYAKALGMTIKLLAMAELDENGQLGAIVAPFLLDSSQPLYNVSDVYNAILVLSDNLEYSMYYGRGAGKLPTASAIISDVVDCVRSGGQSTLCFWDDTDMDIAPPGRTQRRFFVRMANSEANSRATATLFPGHRPLAVINADEYAFLVEPMSEAAFEDSVAKLPDGIISRIRIV